MGVPHSRVIGIYEIRCTVNGMIYVGKSEWVGSRWGYHLSTLLAGTHRNKYLQGDFEKYGYKGFTFSILEIVENKDELADAEMNWVRRHDESQIYNIRLIKNASKSQERMKEFGEYINMKWLVPPEARGVGRDKYLIFRQRDKDEIVDKFMDCGISERAPSAVTFLYVMKFLEDRMGYKVMKCKKRIPNEGYLHCRLVESYDKTQIHK